MTIVSKTAAALVLGALVMSSGSAALASGGGIVIHTPINPDIPIIVNKPDKPQIIPSDPVVTPYQPHLPYIPINWPAPGEKAETPELLLDCKVAEAGDDLWLVNFGADAIPNGTKVRFSVPSTGDHGSFQLNRSIDPGKKLKISDLLHGAQDGAPCRVQILE